LNVSRAVLAPPVVSTRAPDRVTPATMLALSIAEAKRLLRHPVLLAGAALGAWLSIRLWQQGEPVQDWETQNYTIFLLGWAPLYLAAFIVANTAALRERETTTAEMFRSTPTRYAERTLALLAAGLAPTTLAAMLAAIQLGTIAHAGGITVGNQLVQLTPTVVEMALVPATTATSFAFGVALARTVRSRAFGAILAGIATLHFLRWVLGLLLVPGLLPGPLHNADTDDRPRPGAHGGRAHEGAYAQRSELQGSTLAGARARRRPRRLAQRLPDRPGAPTRRLCRPA
jgi:hypothetical protein